MRGFAVIRPVLIILVLLGIAVSPASAAEVLQVRTPSLLQVGDRNRTYTVELPCLTVEKA